MTFLRKLDGVEQQIQQRIQLCDQKVNETRRCLEQEEEIKRRAKERLEEAISTTFSQLRVTFESLKAAIDIEEGKSINIEDIKVPTFGKLDDIKSSCSHKVIQASIESEEKKSQLNVEIIELGIQADKLQTLKDQQLQNLRGIKAHLTLKQTTIQYEHKIKFKILAENIKAAQREKALKREYIRQVQYYDEMNKKVRLRKILFQIKNECRAEAELRLIGAIYLEI